MIESPEPHELIEVTPGYRTVLLDDGEGPPVVLLHALPKASFRVIVDARHLAPLQRPDEVARTVLGARS
jgi:hypothetical protein